MTESRSECLLPRPRYRQSLAHPISPSGGSSHPPAGNKTGQRSGLTVCSSSSGKYKIQINILWLKGRGRGNIKSPLFPAANLESLYLGIHQVRRQEKSSCFNSSSRPSYLHQTSFSTQVASDGTQQSPSIGHEESSKVCQHNLPATQHHRRQSNLLNIEKNSMSSALSMNEIISQPEQSLDLLDTEILTGEEFTPAHVGQGKAIIPGKRTVG